MNGLTATGVTVGICAGLWQLVSSHVGLSQGWELLGTIGFVAFCSFYAAGGGTHGAVDVSEAITVSCNYFFYEVGRLTGIQTLDSYARQFGLGEHTGIEIGDSAGSTASRQVGLDPGYCPDEIDGVIIVLFQACSDSQNIDVENDVFRTETGLPG